MLRQKRFSVDYRATVVAGVFMCVLIRPAHSATLEWVQQLESGLSSVGNGVSPDGAGNVYLAGRSEDAVNSGNAFVAKYDAAGGQHWVRQLGNSLTALGVSADRQGSVYISGLTFGNLSGPNAGASDAFLAKYDAAGSMQWTRQLGTAGYDSAWDVLADGLGNVYTTGQWAHGVNPGSSDAFLAKYNDVGELQWTRQVGQSMRTEAYAVSADGMGNIYITGETGASLDGPNAGGADTFLEKYDPAGNLLWVRQLGTASYDSPWDVSVDSLGNAYISGDTGGSLGGPHLGGRIDGFLAKYDAEGELQWSRQIGTPHNDNATGVSVDGHGNVYLAGSTWDVSENLNTEVNYLYLAKFDSAGEQQSMTQWDVSPLGGISYDASVDGLGNVYTVGNIGNGKTKYSTNAFVAKYSEAVPEPTSAALHLLGSCLLLAYRRNKRPRFVPVR